MTPPDLIRMCVSLSADVCRVSESHATWYNQDHIGRIVSRVAGYGDTDGEARTNEDELE